MAFLKVVFIALEVLLLFNLLIFVHELGHFLAARWRGLKVDRFAIWFGKPIWSTTIGGVEYALGWIPAGGYVALPQMATMETIEGKTEERTEPLPPVPALDKIIVAFAGPLFSFLLALAFALVVMTVGRPVSEAEGTTVVGYVAKDGPADEAGMKVGDKILAVDGQPVTKFGGMGDSVTWRIVSSINETVPIKVERDGQVLVLETHPKKEETKAWQRKGLRKIQIGPAFAAIVAEVATNSPASDAGLKAGDRILRINGRKIFSFGAFEDEVDQGHGAPIQLVVREGKAGPERNLTLTPRIPSNGDVTNFVSGVMAWDGGGEWTLVYPGAIQQVKDSVRAMFETFGALLNRKSNISAQHLGGAVKIMDVYARLFSAEHGWRLALWFSVLMNVNLAFLNLLPIPVLDGGHILLSIIEGVRRKPISHRVGNIIQTTCAVLLIGFMLYIAFYDVQDLPWKRWFRKDTSEELQFAPFTNSVNQD
jgi:regulator of sigma E protease